MQPPSPIPAPPKADPDPPPREELRRGPPVLVPEPPPRRRRGWLVWPAIILALLLPLSYLQLAPIPAIPLLIAFLLLIALDAVEHFPLHGTAARGRLRFIGLLALPPLAAWLLGPLGLLTPGRFPLAVEQSLQVQDGCLAASLLLPAGLSAVMRGGRRFTLAIGIIGFVLTFLIVAVNSVLVDPGS